jgi:hypothetical protein
MARHVEGDEGDLRRIDAQRERCEISRCRPAWASSVRRRRPFCGGGKSGKVGVRRPRRPTHQDESATCSTAHRRRTVALAAVLSQSHSSRRLRHSMALGNSWSNADYLTTGVAAIRREKRRRWRGLRLTPIVVGRTGLAGAWGSTILDPARVALAQARRRRTTRRRVPLDTCSARPLASATWVRLFYTPLTPERISGDVRRALQHCRCAECGRSSTGRSAERASSSIACVIVGYNAAPPTKGRGSCIFRHSPPPLHDGRVRR